MNYEQLNSTLDKKLLNFNFKIFGFIGSLLLKPLANATEPFFRFNMGERYFTQGSAMVCTALWLTASILNNFMNDAAVPLGEAASHPFTSAQILGSSIGLSCLCVFFVLASGNIAAARIRRAKGVAWHSMSRGESIFRSENWFRDVIITLIVAFLLAWFAPVIGAFFLTSRVVSYYLFVKHMDSLIAQHLDQQDMQIEQEFLAPALSGSDTAGTHLLGNNAPPPKTVGGLYCPLPGVFKGENRRNVAAAIARVSPGLKKTVAPEQRQGEGEPPIARPTNPLPNNINPQMSRDMDAATVGKPASIVTEGPTTQKSEADWTVPVQPSAARTEQVVAPNEQPRSAPTHVVPMADKPDPLVPNAHHASGISEAGINVAKNQTYSVQEPQANLPTERKFRMLSSEEAVARIAELLAKKD